MKFDELLLKVGDWDRHPLPGVEAHEAILPVLAKEREDAFQRDPEPRISAVAATFFPKNGLAHLLLIQRQAYIGVHSAQVGFPGGKQEEFDGTLKSTALREMQEEVGVDPSLPIYIGSLSDVYIPPSRFLVHPFVYYIEELPPLVKDPREVKEIIELPLEHLLDDGSIEVGSIKMSNGVAIKTPYFAFDGYQIWGATAMMLSELRQLLKRLNDDK